MTKDVRVTSTGCVVRRRTKSRIFCRAELFKDGASQRTGLKQALAGSARDRFISFVPIFTVQTRRTMTIQPLT